VKNVALEVNIILKKRFKSVFLVILGII